MVSYESVKMTERGGRPFDIAGARLIYWLGKVTFVYNFSAG